jgi:hypothetical protein
MALYAFCLGNIAKRAQPKPASQLSHSHGFGTTAHVFLAHRWLCMFGHTNTLYSVKSGRQQKNAAPVVRSS